MSDTKDAGRLRCQACGARRERAEADDAGARCPGCGENLTRVSVGGTPMLECRDCDGVWLEAADFERICADSETQAAVLHHIAPRGEVQARRATARSSTPASCTRS